jgi:hypothetical protein
MTQAAKPVKKPVASAAPVLRIVDDAVFPERASFPRGPRGSQYDVILTLKPGQALDVPVRDGKQAAQKRSYISAFGKSRRVQIETRFMDVAPEGQPPDLVVRCRYKGPREAPVPETDAED